LLTAAVAKGWLPDPPVLQTELDNDPAFARLKGEPEFEKARAQINGAIARERAQVNLSLMRRAFAAN